MLSEKLPYAFWCQLAKFLQFDELSCLRKNRRFMQCRGKNSLEPREMHSCHHLHVSFPIQQNFVLLPKICAYV